MPGWFKALLWVTAILAIALFALHLVAFDLWRIPTDDPLLAASIQPTLASGDLLLITRRTTIDRANLLRCPDPQAPGRYVIARAIAKPGERIDLQGELVLIDGHRLPSPRACDVRQWTVFDPAKNEDVDLTCAVEDYGEMTFGALRDVGHPEPPTKFQVEPGRWFLVSDDRHVHLDSRDYGTVDASACQHVLVRVVGAKGFSDAQTRLTLIW
jgi:signal peptidase I